MGHHSRRVLMESSFLSKAKNAIHNAAAKAERLLTEIKEDFKTEFGRSTSPTTGSDEPVDEPTHGIKCENEQQLQEKLYECILNISKDPEKKYLLWFKDAGDVPFEYFEDDKDLQNLRFDFVPNKMEEHQFWKYYSMAIDRVKQKICCDSKIAGIDDNIDQNQPALESPRKDPGEEEAYEKAMSLVVVPSSKLLRKLAAVIEIARLVNNVKDLISVKPEKEFTQSAGALVSGMKAVKNSLLRESKDSKTSKEEEVQTCMQSLFEPDIQHYDLSACHTKLVEDIRGAPPGSFVSRMAEIMGGLRTHQRMAEFWCKILLELHHHWDEEIPIPRLPMDGEPDLRYCLILQKLQVINCCIARQKRHAADLSFLDALSECTKSFGPLKTTDLDGFIAMLKSKVAAENRPKLETARLFAYAKEGQVCVRLGADFPAPNLTMLETGQQIYAPKMQEGHVLTEDLIEEKEALILRTGSVGAGCSQLLSDMQAFQAANPGCILEDFVRWYSPPDWRQSQSLESPAKDTMRGTERRGCLSARMQSQGNLWQELWSSAKPIPAARQAPLFDEELAVESTLNELEDISPASLFEQLFIAILGTGFAIADKSSATKGELVSSQFLECKNFVASACGKDMSAAELEQLCQVYEIMETILQYPSAEDVQTSKLFNFFQNGGESVPLAELTSRYCSSLMANERRVNTCPDSELKSSANAKPEQGFALLTRILEAKSTLFEKKQVRVYTSAEDEKSVAAQESEWTVL